MASKLERTCVHARGCIWPASSSFCATLALDSRAPFLPLLHLSLLPPIESCTPHRPRSSFFRSLDTYPFVPTISFLFSLGDIIGCMISFWEFFYHAGWRYLSDWCMARFFSVNFLWFLDSLLVNLFWLVDLFFLFFFWEERERINWIGSYFRLYNDGRNIAFEKVIIFILLVDNFLTIWNDILKKIRFSFEIFK